MGYGIINLINFVMSSLPHFVIVWGFSSIILSAIFYFILGRKLKTLDLNREKAYGFYWLGWNYLSVSSSFIFVVLIIIYQEFLLQRMSIVTPLVMFVNSSFVSMMWVGIAESHTGYFTICMIAILPSVVTCLGIVIPRHNNADTEE